MKFKLSKTSWLILSAGVFLVVLAGLGLTRSQQMKEQTKVAGDLDLATKKLATVQTSSLSQQMETLKTKVDESQALLNDARAHLRQTVVSVDVTDQFFQVAAYCSVNVTTYSSTTIAQAKYDGVTFSTISLMAQVSGLKTDIVKLVLALNDSYITGNVQSAEITFGGPPDEEETEEGEVDGGDEGDAGAAPDATISSGYAKATISMLIYSCEEK
jgi:hypothetical protein